MTSLREIHEQLIIELGTVYQRKVANIAKGRIITGLIGSRGVGKTTFILNYVLSFQGAQTSTY